MDLFHAGTTYQLLCAIVYQQRKAHPGMLLVSRWIADKYPNLKLLEAYFERVTPCDFKFGFDHPNEMTERYLLEITGDLKQYDEIYLWAPQYSLGMYMAEKKLPFVYCEEAAGILSRPEILETIVQRIDPKVYSHNRELGLYSGRVDCVTKRMCNVRAQAEGFKQTEDILDFDVVEEMMKLPEQTLRNIISFFIPDQRIHVDTDAVFLLTQHFSHLKTMEFEEHALVYQLVADYFFPGRKLVFKPHPDDVMYYTKLFGDAQVIRERFPSEFMPFILDNQPQCVATISSTSIYNLRGHYPQVFELDTRYEKDFLMTHRYDAAVRLAQRLGLDIACIGANDVLARRLCETMGDGAPAVLPVDQTDDPCLYLVDDMTESGEAGRREILNRLLALDNRSCVVFINSREDYCWYSYEHKDLWAHIIPVALKKSAIREQNEDFYAPMEDEVLYAYSKNEELLTMIRETDMRKDLPHVGICVEKETMTPEQEKIRMLEGILAATEKRLLYYIEQEKEQSREQLE